jgi:putative transposase
MAEPYSPELRNRVVRAYEAGEGGYAAVGAQFVVGAATVMRWVRLYRANGDTEPLPKGGGTPSTIGGNEITDLLDKLGDPTANELTAEFNRGRRGRARVHVSSMKRALHRHGYVVKKNADGRWRVCVPTS